MAYTNDVLFYIDVNLKRASEEKIIFLGKGIFPESAINEAKQYLLNGCDKVLSKLNKKLAEEASKNRRKVDITLKEIIDIIECLSTNNQKPVINAKNIENIPKVNPESVDLVAVTIKVGENYKSIADILKENVNIKREKDLLSNRVDKLEKYVFELFSKLDLNVSPPPFVPSAPQTSAPAPRLPNPDLTQSPSISAPTNVDTSQINRITPILTAHENKNNEVLQIVNFAPIEETDHIGTELEANTDNKRQVNLTTATLGDEATGTAQTQVNTGSQAVGPVSSTPSYTAASANNLQSSVYVSLGTTHDESVRPKSISSLKHERNLASTQQAITAALEAKKDGKSITQIHDIAMEAAAITCKSYSETLTKMKSNTVNKAGNHGGISVGSPGPTRGTYNNPRQEPTLIGTRNRPNSGQSNQHSNKSSKPFFIAQYKKGKGQSTGIDIAAERPTYLDNKCLVVSRVKRETTIPELQAYINRIADKNVTFLHKPITLSKDYSNFRTVAIELSSKIMKYYQILMCGIQIS